MVLQLSRGYGPVCMRTAIRKVILSRLNPVFQPTGKYQHRAAAEAMSGPHFKFKMYPELMKNSLVLLIGANRGRTCSTPLDSYRSGTSDVS